MQSDAMIRICNVLQSGDWYLQCVSNEVIADVAVSMKTTTTKDVKKWLISKPIKKNIGFLEDGLTARGLESNTKTMFITNAEIHIYMPKTNITPELTTTWMSVLKSENPKIKFEIKG